MKSVKFLGAALIIGLMISFAAIPPNTSVKSKQTESICKKNPVVYVIQPTANNGHVKAKAPKIDDTIAKQLKRKVDFLKDKENFEDKGTVELVINCKGRLVECTMSNKTQDEDLDAQILAVFKQLKIWEAATMRARGVKLQGYL